MDSQILVSVTDFYIVHIVFAILTILLGLSLGAFVLTAFTRAAVVLPIVFLSVMVSFMLVIVGNSANSAKYAEDYRYFSTIQALSTCGIRPVGGFYGDCVCDVLLNKCEWVHHNHIAPRGGHEK